MYFIGMYRLSNLNGKLKNVLVNLDEISIYNSSILIYSINTFFKYMFYKNVFPFICDAVTFAINIKQFQQLLQGISLHHQNLVMCKAKNRCLLTIEHITTSRYNIL